MVGVSLASFAAHADGLAMTADARAQVGQMFFYDPLYQDIDYPMGDIALLRGVCSNVVIRAFHSIGIDLQVVVHEDIQACFAAYPKGWGLKSIDTNIDRCRVPNLATCFRRPGTAVPISMKAADYEPGDIVVWRLSGGQLHIGVISDRAGSSGAPIVIHNIGWGAEEDDRPFGFEITGHYRCF